VFPWLAVPKYRRVVLKDVAAAVFVAGHSEGEFLVTAAAKLKASAEGKLTKVSSHELRVEGYSVSDFSSVSM
jgi:hypothetical protein